MTHPTVFGEPGGGHRLEVRLTVQVGGHHEELAGGGGGGEDHHVRGELVRVLHLQDVSHLCRRALPTCNEGTTFCPMHTFNKCSYITALNMKLIVIFWEQLFNVYCKCHISA